MQAHNANYIGGDINGGVQDFLQLYTRPTLSLNPYKTPVKGIYICSSSTPPGGGVHGYAATSRPRRCCMMIRNVRRNDCRTLACYHPSTNSDADIDDLRPA
jgi:hypothetical protein